MPRQSPPTVETSAGGVVFRCAADGPHYLLILDTYANWGFPKGHIDDREAASHAARREICEETGLENLILHAPLGTIDWFFTHRGRPIHKFCHFYLFESRSGEALPQPEEGITACEWLPIDQALARITFDNARAMLRRAEPLAREYCASPAHPSPR